jgi:phosphate-selective porin OprO/OprP
VHIGASGSWRDLQDQETTLSTRPEAHISDERLVSVDLGNAESAWKAGAELAAVWGPASFQGEYIRSFYDTVSGDAEFDGYYGYVSYFLTGESRAYDGKTGAFKRVKPMSIVGKNGGFGAWEFAARYSYIDLNDGAFNGGRERNYSFGLNWHATPNIRLMANYTYVDSDDTRLERDLDPHVFQGRLQADF